MACNQQLKMQNGSLRRLVVRELKANVERRVSDCVLHSLIPKCLGILCLDCNAGENVA